MKRTSIITVNYHQTDLTVDLLRSLANTVNKELVEVIVVDNGSPDNREMIYQTAYPGLTYIRSERNLGFAGGNNLGIRHASGDYLLFLNNDTEVTAGFIEQMQMEMDRHPQIGLLSPLILYFENKQKIQYAGFTSLNYLTGRNKVIGHMEDDNGQYNDRTVVTGYCHGAAMMCRKKDLERVGLMEEHFFLYYEELDWCEKFHRQGLKTGFTGKARIYHKESMSVGKESPLKTYFMVRNRWLFIRRNANAPIAFMFSCYYLFMAIPNQLLKHLYLGRFDLFKAAWRGVKWNLTHNSLSRDLGITLPDS